MQGKDKGTGWVQARPFGKLILRCGGTGIPWSETTHRQVVDRAPRGWASRGVRVIESRARLHIIPKATCTCILMRPEATRANKRFANLTVRLYVLEQTAFSVQHLHSFAPWFANIRLRNELMKNMLFFCRVRVQALAPSTMSNLYSYSGLSKDQL